MLSMVNKIEFPAWLKKQMDARGIRSNAELARLANLGKDGRAVVWGWINQGKQPSEENLQKIAKALKIPTEEAYRAAGILPPIPAKDAWTERIANLVNQLPDEEKERIYKHAEMIKNILDEKKKPNRPSRENPQLE